MDAKLSFSLEDNTDELLKASAEQIEKALTEVGLEAVTRVNFLVPVDTGRLRASITFATKGHSEYTHTYTDKDGNSYSQNVGKVEDYSVVVGTNVEYAEAVEFREDMQHTTGQAHYLRDGLANNIEEYKRIFKAVLEEG